MNAMRLLKEIYNTALSAWYIRSGMKPWSVGYAAHKQKSIEEAIIHNNFSPTTLGERYGYRLDERIIEYPWLFSRLPDSTGKLLDAGSVLNFEYLLAHPLLGSKKLFISTLAPEPACYASRGISYVYEDLRDSCFRDGYFDWVVSLSTIEHIGLDNTLLYTSDGSKKENAAATYLAAIREYRRMLRPGGKLLLSVPFGQHKNHGWFQVFDSQMVDELIAAFEPSCAQELIFHYHPDGWRASSREESQNATCFDIHHQKHYDPDFAAFSRAIVCLELTR